MRVKYIFDVLSYVLRLLLVLFVAASTLMPLATLPEATATPIEHVVIVIDENHSFDSLFGVYPFGWPPIVDNTTLSVMRPVGLYSNLSQLEAARNGTLTWVSVPHDPYNPSGGYVHPYYAGGPTTQDPAEGWSVYHGDYVDNTSEGFAYYSGPQSMAYFSYEQVAPLWDYAEEYVLADNYYAPMLDLTEPNRVAYLVGFPPNIYSDSAVGVLPFNDSVMYQLSEAGVGWGYYVYGYGGGVPYPLTAFVGVDPYLGHIHTLGDFYSELRGGGLPAVSWVMFLGGNTSQYDMHPPYNVSSGAQMFAHLVDAVMASPYWATTAIFFTFDEGGGYYDQVAPPHTASGSLGQRIPLLVVSSYAKEAWIDNYTLSGYTLIAFIDYNWHLGWLTSTVEQSDIQGLLAAFNFDAPPRPPITLTPQNWTYPIPLQYPVHYGYTATIAGQPTQPTEPTPIPQPPTPKTAIAALAVGVATLAALLYFALRRLRRQTSTR